MNIKSFVFLLLTTCYCQHSFGEKRVIIHVKDGSSTNTSRDYPRTPIRIPDAYIDGHTLTFDASCIGCTLTLTQDDIIIYSATVEENENGEGEVILPEDLTGEYEVLIEFGSITLVGIIEL